MNKKFIIKEKKDEHNYNNNSFELYTNDKKQRTSIKGWRSTILKPYINRLSKKGISEEEFIRLATMFKAGLSEKGISEEEFIRLATMFKAVNKKQSIREIEHIANIVEAEKRERVLYWYILLFRGGKEGRTEFNKEIKDW